MKVEASAPTMNLPDEHLPIGELFAGRYEVQGLVGEGGMGAVYRVRDVELDEAVALKLLRPEVARSDGALERFRREVKLARKVTHPNVARTYDLGTLGVARYITMEFIRGVALCDRPSPKMSLGDALRVAADVCRGLSAAHAVGVVHRDLKPDNVMIDGVIGDAGIAGAARVVITDFGIARLLEAQEAPTQTGPQRALTVGAVVGTPAYMAPEQVLGKDLDGRADIFALGVVLFELLTGRLPFTGESAYAMAAARLSGRAPDVREHEPEVPASVAALVAEAMSVRRDDRPDAQRMLQALESLRGGGGEGSLSLRGGTEVVSTRMTPAEAALNVGASPRAVAVLPFDVDASDAATAALARQLAASVADGLTKMRALRVVPPALSGAAVEARGGELDLAAVARATRVDRVLAGTVRTSGARARVNLRLIDPGAGAQVWAERYDGDLVDPFAIEDMAVRGAAQALRATMGAADDGVATPDDPAVRALFERARALYHRFTEPAAVNEAVELLRKAHELAPSDGLVMSALGAALMRSSLLASGDDARIEAEDWALRALAADPSIAETYTTLGLVRLHQGNLKASLKAFREALARNPRSAEASSYVGRFLAEAGHTTEGIRRMELALRVDPAMQRAWWDLARTYALLGEDARADAALDRGEAAGGTADTSFMARGRIVLWRKDVAAAKALVARMESMGAPEESGGRRALLPALRSMIANDGAPDPSADITQAFAAVIRSPANRTFVWQVSAEVRGAGGDTEGALDSLEKAAALSLMDLLWLDRCPSLAPLRESPRYGKVRAAVAARTAELLGG